MRHLDDLEAAKSISHTDAAERRLRRERVPAEEVQVGVLLTRMHKAHRDSREKCILRQPQFAEIRYRECGDYIRDRRRHLLVVTSEYPREGVRNHAKPRTIPFPATSRTRASTTASAPGHATWRERGCKITKDVNRPPRTRRRIRRVDVHKSNGGRSS
jgi:hypothetical protein